tara:strand:- start:1103 stop:2878 length:1776 start_codon:yes stop_codon:yes gene_type:complete
VAIDQRLSSDELGELEALLEVATEEEAEAIRKYLATEVALESPLDYACYVSPETIRYKHVLLLNDYIAALCEFRLYEDGPGPPPIWFYRTSDGQVRSIDDVWSLPINPEDEDYDDENPIEEWWGQHPHRPEMRVKMRLALAMPPRHGKSWLTTLHTPGWYLSRWPDRKIAVLTYSDDFSWEWGDLINNQLRDDNEFVQTKGNRTLIRETEFKGEMRFAGMGGRITGTGYHLGLVDDPFKNDEEANSVAIRNSKDRWYGSTFLTRKEPRAVEILMFTRWHEDDISGRRVFEPESSVVRKDWVYLNLPALALDPAEVGEEDYVDPIGRSPGAALCPARKTRTELETIRDEDPLFFEAMYQGSPTLDAGGILSPPYHHWSDSGTHYRLHTDDISGLLVPKRDCVRFATVDLAATKNTWSDFSVFGVWDFHKDMQQLILVSMERTRIESAEHETWLLDNCRTWSVETVGIEDATYGKTLIQYMIRRGGLHVWPLKVDGTDKISRAIPYGAGITQSRVWFPKGAPWLHVWELEHRNFPNSTHDDMVDVGSYAWHLSRSMPATHRISIKEDTFEEKCYKQLETSGKGIHSLAHQLSM